MNVNVRQGVPRAVLLGTTVFFFARVVGFWWLNSNEGSPTDTVENSLAWRCGGGFKNLVFLAIYSSRSVDSSLGTFACVPLLDCGRLDDECLEGIFFRDEIQQNRFGREC